MAMANMQPAGGPSFGQGESGLGSTSARGFWDSERRALLERSWSYFACRQHENKKWDFDGRPIQGTQPLLGGGPPGFYVPLRARRPSSPYRLARVIVTSFTSMLLGEHRFPELTAPGDATTQDYVQAISQAASLPARFQRMRNLGGATGTACCSWGYVLGKPRVRVHNAKNVHVHSWDDRDEMIPRHVSECFLYEKEEWDPEKGRVVKVPYWHRRDWLPSADVLFFPCRARQGEEPVFIPDEEHSYLHGDGVAHFVLGQNLPDDDLDGETDYEGLLENFDTLDVMLSILARGAVLNLDPTLKLKMDPDLVDRMGVKKGSENAIVTGEEGDAEYMELEGTSLEAGTKLFNVKRSLTLETAQCVIPDPDKVAAAGTSSVAIKAIYKPMTDRTDVLREQYGGMLRRLLEPFLAVARHKHGAVVTIFEPDDQGQPQPKTIETYIDLPPKAVEDPSGDLGDDGKPQTVMVEREPGDGRSVLPAWPDYFLPTPLDQQNTVTTLVAAAGGPGVQILSKRTASGEAAKVYGKDPSTEWQAIQKEQGEVDDRRNQMMTGLTSQAPALGASMKTKISLPDGTAMEHHHDAADPPEMPDVNVGAPPPDPGDEDAQIPLTPTGAMAIVTVNEARSSMGLHKLEGPDGDLTLAAYTAKYRQPIALAANAQLGQTGVKPAAAPPGAGPPKPPGSPPGGPPGAPPHPPPPHAVPPGAAPPHPSAPPGGPPPALPHPPAPPPLGFPPKK